MSEMTTPSTFDPRLDLEALLREKLVAVWEETARAYENLMGLWRIAVAQSTT